MNWIFGASALVWTVIALEAWREKLPRLAVTGAFIIAALHVVLSLRIL